jgi:hypothetical protein
MGKTFYDSFEMCGQYFSVGDAHWIWEPKDVPVVGLPEPAGAGSGGEQAAHVPSTTARTRRVMVQVSDERKPRESSLAPRSRLSICSTTARRTLKRPRCGCFTDPSTR